MNLFSKLSAIAVIAACAASCNNAPEVEWAPAGDHILTQWGETLDPATVHSEYPRPQMQRADWINLNGFWDYTVGGDQGKILVPFCIESALSGVGRTLANDEKLIYTRTFRIPGKFSKQNILLNAGGIDCNSEIYVNDQLVASHKGGFTSFSADITKYLVKGENTIRVEVIDNTDNSFNAVGKQTNNPRGIWYTAVSGIWQTIWLEPVAENHIEKVNLLPDVDAGVLYVTAPATAKSGVVSVDVFDGDAKVASASGNAGEAIAVKIADAHLWNPDDPFLYDLKISLKDGGKVVDNITSYAAMRKVSKERTPDGFYRIFLNNEPIFSMGPLDQGWWPDGLYTAPSDEALLYDIQKTKDLGFNSIRKHTKVEPDRFYYHCDRVGIMVWQDMPSGDIPGSPWNEGRFAFLDNDPRQRPSESMEQYYADWEGIMDQLYSHPSIIMWVPFNEGWGQSNTVEVTEWTKKKDPSRLVNPASGGNLFRTGDVLDIHNYPAPIIRGYDSEYINVLGEYGGIGLPVEGHLWKESDDKNKNWGYVTLEGIESVTRKYVEFAQILLGQVYEGTSAAIYTQTTDVEIEVNGLMTYDRKVLKVDEKRVAKANKALCQSLGYGMKVHEITARADKFASVKGKDAEFVTLTNNNGTVINISSYGARVVDWVVADKNGEPRNIVWGFSSIEEFCTPGTKYAGPVVGRYGNRLAKGQFSIDGTAYQVDKNENGNHLHGGIGGFESIVWETEKFSDENGNDAVRFTYDSPDGDQGYPGELKVSVVFTLNSDNELVLDYEAVPVNKPTVCNLTLHPFFNLHGRGLGLASTHQVTFNADRFTPVDAELIPTGEIKPIKELISDMTKLPTLDNNMVLKENNGEGLNLAVTVTEPSTGITLEILTDQPAVQCYNAEPAHGIVLEPQNFPDAPNHENFPNSVYRPGEKYTQTSVYRVTVK